MIQESSPNRGGKPVSAMDGSADLTLEVAGLPTLHTTALEKKWAALFDAEPSPHLGRNFMIRAIAYRLQEKALGGLKPSTLRILDRVADGSGSNESKRAPARRAGAGTVLIREWGGVTHRVTVLDDAVVYRGRRYKSLSEVARVITGAHWSGPMFFGLRNRSKEKAHG
jgi:hypothetical protein